MDNLTYRLEKLKIDNSTEMDKQIDILDKLDRTYNGISYEITNQNIILDCRFAGMKSISKKLTNLSELYFSETSISRIPK